MSQVVPYKDKRPVVAKAYAPGGCPIPLGKQKCGETQGLDIIMDFHKLYQEKMNEIDVSAGGDSLQEKVDLQEQWIEDLTAQNKLLARVIEELESETIGRVQQLEDKLNNAVKSFGEDGKPALPENEKNPEEIEDKPKALPLEDVQQKPEESDHLKEPEIIEEEIKNHPMSEIPSKQPDNERPKEESEKTKSPGFTIELSLEKRKKEPVEEILKPRKESSVDAESTVPSKIPSTASMKSEDEEELNATQDKDKGLSKASSKSVHLILDYGTEGSQVVEPQKDPNVTQEETDRPASHGIPVVGSHDSLELLGKTPRASEDSDNVCACDNKAYWDQLDKLKEENKLLREGSELQRLKDEVEEKMRRILELNEENRALNDMINMLRTNQPTKKPKELPSDSEPMSSDSDYPKGTSEPTRPAVRTSTPKRRMACRDKCAYQHRDTPDPTQMSRKLCICEEDSEKGNESPPFIDVYKREDRGKFISDSSSTVCNEEVCPFLINKLVNIDKNERARGGNDTNNQCPATTFPNYQYGMDQCQDTTCPNKDNMPPTQPIDAEGIYCGVEEIALSCGKASCQTEVCDQFYEDLSQPTKCVDETCLNTTCDEERLIAVASYGVECNDETCPNKDYYFPPISESKGTRTAENYQEPGGGMSEQQAVMLPEIVGIPMEDKEIQNTDQPVYPSMPQDASAAEQPYTGIGEKPSTVDDEKQTAVDSVAIEDRAIQISEKPSATVEDVTQSGVNEKPSEFVREEPLTYTEDTPNVMDYPAERTSEKPSLDRKPDTGVDENPSTTIPEQPSSAADEKPSSVIDEKPSAGADKMEPITSVIPSAVASEKPSAVVSEKPSAAASEKPSAVVSEKPSAAASEKPSVAASEKPSAVVSEKPSAVASEKPSATVSEKPSDTMDTSMDICGDSTCEKKLPEKEYVQPRESEPIQQAESVPTRPVEEEPHPPPEDQSLPLVEDRPLQHPEGEQPVQPAEGAPMRSAESQPDQPSDSKEPTETPKPVPPSSGGDDKIVVRCICKSKYCKLVPDPENPDQRLCVDSSSTNIKRDDSSCVCQPTCPKTDPEVCPPCEDDPNDISKTTQEIKYPKETTVMTVNQLFLVPQKPGSLSKEQEYAGLSRKDNAPRNGEYIAPRKAASKYGIQDEDDDELTGNTEIKNADLKLVIADLKSKLLDAEDKIEELKTGKNFNDKDNDTALITKYSEEINQMKKSLKWTKKEREEYEYLKQRVKLLEQGKGDTDNITSNLQTAEEKIVIKNQLKKLTKKNKCYEEVVQFFKEEMSVMSDELLTLQEVLNVTNVSSQEENNKLIGAILQLRRINDRLVGHLCAIEKQVILENQINQINEARINELQNIISAKNNDLTQHDDLIQDMRRKLNNATKQNVDLKNTIKNLTDTVVEIQEGIKSVERDQMKNLNDVSVVESKVCLANGDLESIKTCMEQKNSRIVELENQLKSKEVDLTLATKELSMLKEKKASSKEMIKSLKEQLTLAEKKNQQIVGDYQVVVKKLKDYSSLQHMKEYELNHYKSLVGEMKISLGQLNNGLEKCEASNIHFYEDLRNSDHSRGMLQHRKNSLPIVFDELKKSMADLKKRLSDADFKGGLIQEELLKVKESHMSQIPEELTDTQTELETKIIASIEEQSRLNQLVQEQKDEIQRLKTELEKEKAEVCCCKRSVSELKNEKTSSNAQVELSRLRCELNKSIHRQKLLDEENDQIHTQMINLRKKLTVLEQAYDVLKQEKEEYKMQLKRTIAEKEYLTHKNHDLSKTIEQMRSTHDQLEKQCRYNNDCIRNLELDLSETQAEKETVSSEAQNLLGVVKMWLQEQNVVNGEIRGKFQTYSDTITSLRQTMMKKMSEERDWIKTPMQQPFSQRRYGTTANLDQRALSPIRTKKVERHTADARYRSSSPWRELSAYMTDEYLAEDTNSHRSNIVRNISYDSNSSPYTSRSPSPRSNSIHVDEDHLDEMNLNEWFSPNFKETDTDVEEREEDIFINKVHLMTAQVQEANKRWQKKMNKEHLSKSRASNK